MPEPHTHTCRNALADGADGQLRVAGARAGMLAVAMVAAIALAAGAMVVLAAGGHGVGVSPDSVVYLDAARNLADGRGLVCCQYPRQAADGPLTHYPPLLPGALAAFAKCGADPLAAVRWFNAAVLAASVFVFGLLVMRCVARPVPAAALTAAFALAGPVTLVHFYVWSEPLFILLSLAALGALARRLAGGGVWWLVAAGAAAGLAILTRYAGVAIVLAGCVLLVCRGGALWRRRLGEPALFGVISCAGLVGWLARNHYAAGGNLANRAFATHLPDVQWYLTAMRGLVKWTPVPGDLRLPLVLAMIAAAGYCIWRVRAAGKTARAAAPTGVVPITQVTGAFVLAYLAVIWLSKAFFDAAIIFEARTAACIIGPMLLCATALVVAVRDARRSSLSLAAQPSVEQPSATPRTSPAAAPAPACPCVTNRRRIVTIVAVVLCLAALAAHVVTGAIGIYEFGRHGLGYTSDAWRNSPTISHIRTLPPGTAIYSDLPDAVYYLTGRRALPIPRTTHWLTNLPDPAFAADSQAMRDALADGSAVVVCFQLSGPKRMVEDLQGRLGLRVVETFTDGVVLGK